MVLDNSCWSFYAIIYYLTFKWYFTKKNLSIDVADNDNENKQVKTDTGKYDTELNIGIKVIEGLGGKENIKNINNCISRLRVDVINMDKINMDILKNTGSMGIVKPSDTHVHIIYGPKVEKVANAVKEALKIVS